MNTPLYRWLATEPGYLPHYSHTQQIIGTTILATFAAITALTFIILRIIQRRRGRKLSRRVRRR